MKKQSITSGITLLMALESIAILALAIIAVICISQAILSAKTHLLIYGIPSLILSIAFVLHQVNDHGNNNT